MFILIQGAYRQIEVEHNPLLREARQRAASTYETGDGESKKSDFKSKRKENKERGFYENSSTGNAHQERAYDWNEEKFLRRYRY